MEGVLDYAIVPAGPGDAAELGRVHVKSWRETYPGLLPQAYLAAMRPQVHARRFYRELIRAREGDAVLLAEGADGAVGYAAGVMLTGHGRAADAEVHTLYVLREAQDAGLGRRLLTDTARVLAARGAVSLIIWVLRDNTYARAFYEHLGGKLEAARVESVGGRVIPSVGYRWERLGGWLGA